MKKFLIIILAVLLLLTSCDGSSGYSEDDHIEDDFSETDVSNSTDVNEQKKITCSPTIYTDDYEYLEHELSEYAGLGDQELLNYIEFAVYREAVSKINSNNYFVENVEAIYISNEYINELIYNSNQNVYFGYTLAEINKAFTDSKYVFTVDDNGNTIVEAYTDCNDVFEQVITDVAIGTGVILICVTVSVATAGTAPAISMIFAASAQSAAIMATSSSAMGAAAAAFTTGIQNGDKEEVLRAAAIGAGEGFKAGAITGAITGGITQTVQLKGATRNGLTMNEVATIQKESGYPLDVIKNFRSMDQYNACKQAGLRTSVVNGKVALIRDIDLNFTDEFGRTNLQRMQQGLAALDPATGKSYQLHHIGQEMDSTLSILTQSEHMQGGNNTLWHVFESSSNIDRVAFDIQRQEFWKSLATLLIAGG